MTHPACNLRDDWRLAADNAAQDQFSHRAQPDIRQQVDDGTGKLTKALVQFGHRQLGNGTVLRYGRHDSAPEGFGGDNTKLTSVSGVRLGPHDLWAITRQILPGCLPA